MHLFSIIFVIYGALFIYNVDSTPVNSENRLVISGIKEFFDKFKALNEERNQLALSNATNDTSTPPTGSGAPPHVHPTGSDAPPHEHPTGSDASPHVHPTGSDAPPHVHPTGSDEPPHVHPTGSNAPPHEHPTDGSHEHPTDGSHEHPTDGSHEHEEEHMGMTMYFHFSDQATILFHGWQTNSWYSMLGSCLAIFFLSVLYELLKTLRDYVSYQDAQAVIIGVYGKDSSKFKQTPWSKTHLIQTLLHFVQVWLSFCMMLVFMTYNVYLCLAVTLGAAAGYFACAWKRHTVTDLDESCH